MATFNYRTMEKLGKRIVSDTWDLRTEKQKKARKTRIAKYGWQPNVSGPYSGFK